VNGRNLVGVSHHDAVDVLREAGNNVTVVVARLVKKADVRPLSNHPPARTVSKSSTGRSRQPLSPTPDDVPPPSSMEPPHQGPVASPARQSCSPEPATSARLSGTGSTQCEVGDSVAVLYFHCNHCLRYRDGAGNTAEENSSVFSLIQMR